jgi:hypothetical protein
MAAEVRGRGVRYPVVFQEANGAPAAGALSVEAEELLLTGRPVGAAAEPVALKIACTNLARVRIGRGAGERLDGHATVVLERSAGGLVLVAPFGGGLLHEIADLLAALTSGRAEAAEQLTLVVPIKRACGQQVRRLIAQGPPFDPAAHGLRRHDVFLGEQTVVFVFEGPQVRSTLRRTLSDPGLWRAGIAWRDCIAGQPQIAEPDDNPAKHSELIYSWHS